MSFGDYVDDVVEGVSRAWIVAVAGVAMTAGAGVVLSTVQDVKNGAKEWDAICTFNGNSLHGSTKRYGDRSPSAGFDAVVILKMDGSTASVPVNACSFTPKS